MHRTRSTARRLESIGKLAAPGAAVAIALMVFAPVVPADADPRVPTAGRVSVSTAEQQANGSSGDVDVSADGRFVAFASTATDLVPGDTNGLEDVFVRDRLTGTTSRVSVAPGGAQANGPSEFPSISDDGQVVAFESTATNLVTGDGNGVEDVFVRDRGAATTTRVSVSSTETEGSGDSTGASVSGNGLFVAFQSDAEDLIAAGDTNGERDIFRRDLGAGTTIRVSVGTPALGGAQAEGSSFAPSTSGDGNLVAFQSLAPDVVLADTNATMDVFVRDVGAGSTTRVSVATGGSQLAEGGFIPSISGTGQFVAFHSRAGDPGDDIDVMLRNRTAATTVVISLGPAAVEGNGDSLTAAVSDDGAVVVFESEASNLVVGDTNQRKDVFVRDVAAGVTRRVSASATGVGGNLRSEDVTVSGGGRVIAFASAATNLVAGDTNGRLDVFVAAELCAGRPVTVDLSAAQSPTAGPDVILGTSGGDTVNALGGNDVFCGLGGTDSFFGGNGNDRALGGDGTDTLRGEAGNDTLEGGADHDVLNGGPGNDTCKGGSGPDTSSTCETTTGIP